MSGRYTRRRAKTKALPALVCVALTIASAMSWAAAGNLDPTFSGDGVRTVAFGTDDDFATAVAMRSDGRIVVAGEQTPSATASHSDFAVASLKPSGALDQSFSNDGRRAIGITPGGSDSAHGVAIQRDGKIVVAGLTSEGPNQNFAVARLRATGDLDPAFSSDGRKAFGFGNGVDDDTANAVAIQSDGKIVIAGVSEQGSAFDLAVARLNSNGSFDTAFSNDGRRTVSFTPADDRGYAVAIQADGKIVVAGDTNGATPDTDFIVARINPGGGLDTAFSGDGRTVLPLAGGNREDEARGVAIRSDGKIVVAGTLDNGAGSGGDDFAVARLRPGGGIDGTFAGGGIATTGFNNGDGNDTGLGMALQQDGKIVVVGFTTQGGVPRTGVARLTPNGGLDSSFSNDGRRFIVQPSEQNSEANAVAIRGGRIVAAGDGYFGSTRGYDFTLAALKTG